MKILIAAAVCAACHGLSVGIIGGGPAGLTFARALQYLPTDVDCKVYHNGATLEPALGGGVQINAGSTILRKLGLSATEKADLVAFLHTLTSSDKPALIPLLPR